MEHAVHHRGPGPIHRATACPHFAEAPRNACIVPAQEARRPELPGRASPTRDALRFLFGAIRPKISHGESRPARKSDASRDATLMRLLSMPPKLKASPGTASPRRFDQVRFARTRDNN
jgi:hypothetical protein